MTSAVEKPYLAQNSCSTGMKNATTGVLLRNAEMVPAMMHRRSRMNWMLVVGPVPISSM